MGSRGSGIREISGARGRVLAAAAGLAAIVVLGGCDEMQQARLDFSTIEKVKITEIRLSGGGGNVVVGPGPVGEVRIDRVVRYRGPEPGKTYRIEGSVLHVETDCGQRCGVSYDIHAPAGVAVRGQNSSGDLILSSVSAVDVKVDSGTVTITDATGNVKVTTSSGDVRAVNVAGNLTADVSSGSVVARGLTGATTQVTTSSGDINLSLNKPGSVLAEASSGSIDLVVPAGSYRVDAHADSGEVDVRVPTDPAGQYHLQLNAESGDVTVTAR
jgi:hypothetical protein